MSSIAKGIATKRILSVVLNVLMISSLMFSTFTSVFAQDGGTPTPTETPTVTPIVTDTPTVETPVVPTVEPPIIPTETPTLEPTIVNADVGLPNLNLAAPDGWEGPVILSLQAGAKVSATLTDGEQEYLSFSILNNGFETPLTFTSCLKVDGEQVQCWDANGLTAGAFFTVEDWLYNADRGAGSHHFEIILDANNTVAETDELDNTWSFDFTWLPSEMQSQSEGLPLINDELQTPDLPGMAAQSATASEFPGRYDVSAYMIDSIAIGVILPESAGSSENWTTIEQTQVSDEIQAGLARWADWSDNTTADTNLDQVFANVSFTYEFNNSIPVTDEPIQLSSNNDCTWISEALGNMGYTNPSGCWERVYDYLNDLRTRKGTDWATAIFVVDSSADTDGMFSNGYFGYAYINGPRIVLTYDNDGWGISRMDLVAQHEMGHIFGAGDNYYQAGYGGCTSTTALYGYLGIANSNCAYNNPGADTNVLMNSNAPDRNHWTGQYQVGWKDSDGDRIADVVDTIPGFSLSSLNNVSLAVSGVAFDQPKARNATTYARNVTINNIASVRYHVDSGGWQSVSAADGSYNTDRELVNFTMPPLMNGLHTLYIEITNLRGNVYTYSTNFSTFQALPIAPTLTTPANALVTVDTTPDFGWNAVTNGVTYEIQIDNLATFAAPIEQTAAGLGLAYTATPLTDGLKYWRVRAVNLVGEPGAWSLARVITIDTTAPLPPALSLPANAAIVRATPTFSWLAAATANAYQFAYDDEANCPSPLYTSGVQATLTHLPPAMALGTFNWCVQSRDPAGNWSGWSASRTVIIRQPIPVAPVLTAPANALVTLDTTPDFGWNATAYGDTYEIQIDNLATFADPIEQTAAGLALTYTATPLTDGVKYWRVRAINIHGEPGAWSLARVVTIDTTAPLPPALSLPANAAISRGTPTFSWLAAATANAYQFAYDDEANCPTPLYTSGIQATLTHVPPTMGLGTYNWCVQSRDPAGNWSGWSASRTVTIRQPIPVAPVLTAPANALVTLDTTPDFAWNATAYGDTYEIQIDNLATFAAPIEQTAAALGLTYTATPLTDGVKYWRVRAINIHAEPGAWSAARVVTIDTVAPLPPALSLPANAAISRGTPTFSWLAAATANAYQFAYDDEANCPTPLYTSPVQATLTHLPPAMALGTFNWCVQSRDPAGNWSGWSASRTVTVRQPIPVAPLLTLPANALVTLDTTPDFIWSAVTYGDTYEIQIDNLATFTAPIEQTTAALGLTYTATPLTDGVKYWRVRAVNIHGEPGAWSLARVFTIDTVAPLPPALSLPANAAIVRGTPTFSWLAAATANAYQFAYDDEANCPTPLYTSGIQATLTHLPPAMALGTFNWCVQSRDPAGNWSGWSASRTVIIRQPIPVAPVLTAPANALVTLDTTPDFAWNAITYGDTYEIQIDNLATFAAPIEQTAAGLALTYTATPLTDGVKYWRVRAVNIHGEPGAWSLARVVTIDTVAPLPPALSLPANAAIVRGTPVFSWLAAATANAYQFAYDDEANCPSPLYTSGIQATLTHLPPAMALGTFNWCVQSRDPAGNWSGWSASRTVTIRQPIPVAPVLTAPVNALVTLDTTPDFAWNATAYGDTYEIQIDNLATFAAPIEQTAAGLGLAYTATPLTDGLKYWRVRAVNVHGEPGAWSLARVITIDTTAPLPPALSLPANAAISRGTPTFSWLAAATANAYQFAYDDEANCPTPLYTSAVQATLTHLPPAMALGTFNWCVQSRDPAGNWSGWSASRTVIIRQPIPVAPVLTAPANALVTLDTTPDFIWSAVTYGDTYEIQIDNLATFADPIEQTAAGLALTYTATPLTDGVKYWRVRAINIHGEPGAWSLARVVTIDTTAPLPPALSLPANAAISRGTPTFSWLAAATANAYQFAYDDEANCPTPLYTSAVQATLTHLPPTMGLGTYNWCVQSRDPAGNWSGWSASRTVTIRQPIPVAPVLTAPANALVTLDTTPDFAWNSVAYGDTYEIQIDNLATFAAPIEQTAAALGLTYTATPLTDGVKYWRVRAINIHAEPGAWSAARVVTIDTVAPLPPALSLPANNAPGIRATPTFSWLAAVGANAYQFQYDEAVDFATPFYTSGVLAVTTHIPTPAMGLGTWYWRAMARDVAGNWSDWSAPRTIEIRPPLPVAPLLTGPATGFESEDLSPDFAWNAVANGTTYEIQIDHAATFTAPVEQTVDGLGLTYTASTLTPGLKYWRVRALNNSSVPEPGPWSLARSFTVYASFNTQFNTYGNFEGWEQHPGAGWSVTGGVLTTNGLSYWDTSSASYGGNNLTDFVYEARIVMGTPGAEDDNDSGLLIRGTPTFTDYNDWQNGYYFDIHRVNYSGFGQHACYNVFKITNGLFTSLTPYGYYYCYDEISYSGYNTMKVYAKGTTLKFYINGYLFLTKVVSGPLSGRVGVFNYGYSARTTNVDWALAGMPILPPGSITPASLTPGMATAYFSADNSPFSKLKKPSVESIQ